MNMNSFKIIPFLGFGKIILGSSIKQTKILLGEPKDIKRQNYHDGLYTIIHSYTSPLIDLSFDSDEDFKLGGITVFEPKATLNGERLIGLNENEFKI